MAYNPLSLHDSIGNNTWEQTWRRVFVVDTLSNIGIDRGNKQMADGEGHPSPFIVGLTQLGVSGGQKLYFGYKENYIRQIRKGILEFGAVKLVANAISIKKITGEGISIANVSTQNIYAHTGKFDRLNKIDYLEFGEIKGDKIEADIATLSKINFNTLSGKDIKTDQLHIENLLLNNLVANDIKSNYKIKSQIGDFITVSTNLIKTGTFNIDYLNVNNHLNVDSLSAKSIEANELHTNLSILGTLQAVSIICSNLQATNFDIPQEITIDKLNANVISSTGAVINNIAGTDIYGVNIKGTNLSSSTVRTTNFWSKTQTVSKSVISQLSVLSTAMIKTLSSNQIKGYNITTQFGAIDYFNSDEANICNFTGDDLFVTFGDFSTLYSSTISASDFYGTNASIEKIIGTNISMNKVKGNTVSFNSIIGSNASFGTLKMDTVSANKVKGNTLSMSLAKSTTASSGKFMGTTVSAGLVKGTTASLGIFKGTTASMSNFKGGTASLTIFKGGTASTNKVKGLSIYATQWIRSANISASTKIITNQLSTLSTAKIKTISTSKVKGTTVSVNTVRGLSIYSTNWLRSANVSANYLKSANLSVSTKITANQLSTTSLAKIKTISSNKIRGANISIMDGVISAFSANWADIYDGFIGSIYTFDSNGWNLHFDTGEFDTKIKSPMVSATNMKGVSLQGFDNVMVWF